MYSRPMRKYVTRALFMRLDTVMKTKIWTKMAIIPEATYIWLILEKRYFNFQSATCEILVRYCKQTAEFELNT